MILTIRSGSRPSFSRFFEQRVVLSGFAILKRLATFDADAALTEAKADAD
jgi:hypothetical protein